MDQLGGSQASAHSNVEHEQQNQVCFANMVDMHTVLEHCNHLEVIIFMNYDFHPTPSRRT